MSEFNPSIVKQQMPGRIDEILAQHKKAVSACDSLDEIAKVTGAKQFMDDAVAFRRVMESLNDFAVRMCGHEGDTTADDGTFYASIEVAKKLEIATGGAD